VKPLFKNLPDDCETSYRNIFLAKTSGSKRAREYCEALWERFHDLADKDFVNLFPFKFHQRWFEMYLGAALRDAGLDVSAPKPGPDFCVNVDGRQIFIEAIAPEPGDPLHADHVPEPDYKNADGSPKVSQVPHTSITLRLAGAFHDKAGAYNRYRIKNRVPQDAICVIAINLWDIPHAWADDKEFWSRALYGVGDRFVSFDRDGNAAVEGRQHRELLRGTGGHDTEVAPLLADNLSDIAGVIGSAADAGNPRSPLGDDFLLMPHAAAKYPYPAGFISRGIELKVRPAAQAGVWDVETVDHGAVEPHGPSSLTVAYKGEAHKVQWQVAGRELSVKVGGRGITQPINRRINAAALAADVARTMLGYYDREASDD
jgi:type I restriction enzyme S subunit